MPFAEIPQLRNMVLTGEDDGDMSYMRMQERQLKPGASDRRALPPSHSSRPSNDRYDDSAVVPHHGGRQASDDYMVPRGQGRYSQGPYDNDDQDRQNGRNHNSEKQGRRGGFRPTYD